jgi:hypothetical protein
MKEELPPIQLRLLFINFGRILVKAHLLKVTSV